MRIDRFSFLWLLAMGALTFAACGKGGDAPKLAVQSPVSTAQDEVLIQGKWLCFEYSEDGVRVPGGGGIRAVFTAQEAKIGSESGAFAYSYKLHSDTAPKSCELSVPGLAKRRIAYDLKGDLLILASHLAEDEDLSAPKSLEPAPGISISKFRRFDPAIPLASAAKPLSAEEDVALSVLRQQLSSFRELFEKQQYEEILAEMISPDTRRKLQESKAEKEQFLSRMKKLGENFAKLLAAIETQRPVFNATRTRASFDTRLIHFDGLPGMAQVTFQKEGDAWYMAER